MKSFVYTGLLLILIGLSMVSQAQSQKKSTAWWLFPGLEYKFNQHFRIDGQAGYITGQQIKLVYLQAFVKISNHFTLNPAYLLLQSDRPGVETRNEHSILNAIIYNTRFWHFTIEDRNMVWDRFANSAASLHFYRNRLKIAYPFIIHDRNFKLYSFDEASYFLNDGSWTRNRLAAGFSADLIKNCNLDFFCAHQYDKTVGNKTLLYVALTLVIKTTAPGK